MDNRLIGALAAVLVVMVVLLVAMSLRSEEVIKPPEPEPEPTGCQEDARVCPDGTTVVRIPPECEFEECPPETAFGEELANAANTEWGGVMVYPDSGVMATEGWLRTVFNVPNAAELPYQCYLFMGKKPEREINNVTITDFSEGSNTTCKIQFAGLGGCGDAMVSIDLEGVMAAGTLDNWQDFFSCQTTSGSDFCQSECDTLLDGLMERDSEITIQ